MLITAMRKPSMRAKLRFFFALIFWLELLQYLNQRIFMSLFLSFMDWLVCFYFPSLFLFKSKIKRVNFFKTPA